MGVSRSLIPSLTVILCAATCVAQSSAPQQERSSPPPLPRDTVPVYRLHDHAQVTFLKPDSPEVAGVLANNSQRCYTLRQYQFEQVDPQSDVTRLRDYTACQPAGKIRLRGAIVSPSR